MIATVDQWKETMISSALPFGELLQTFRKRKKMSQKVLASKLGVHRNTIYGWECGDWLPDRTRVPEIASVLGLNSLETRQLLEAALLLTQCED